MPDKKLTGTDLADTAGDDSQSYRPVLVKNDLHSPFSECSVSASAAKVSITTISMLTQASLEPTLCMKQMEHHLATHRKTAREQTQRSSLQTVRCTTLLWETRN